MKTQSPWFTPIAVAIFSAMFWISGVALFCVHVLGLSVATGWNIVAGLAFLAVLGGTIVVHEIRHAVDLSAPPKRRDPKPAYGMAWTKEVAGAQSWVVSRRS